MGVAKLPPSAPPSLSEGSRFYCAWAERAGRSFCKTSWVTITSVGVRWCYIDTGDRIDRTSQSWRVVQDKSHTEVGRLFDSQECHEEALQIEALLGTIRRGLVKGLRPASSVDVLEAIRLLGFEEEQKDGEAE